MEFKKFSVDGITYGVSGDIDEKIMLDKQYLGEEPISNVSFKDDRVFESIKNTESWS